MAIVVNNVGIVVEDLTAVVEFFTELVSDDWCSTRTWTGSATSVAPRESSSGLRRASAGAQQDWGAGGAGHHGPDLSSMRPVVFTNPDLNGKVPLRVQPEVGEWGPLQVTTARTRSRHRALMPLLFLTMVCAVVGLGWYMFLQLQTGEMSDQAEIVVMIGKFALPILLVLSLALTVVVWIKGDPTVKEA